MTPRQRSKFAGRALGSFVVRPTESRYSVLSSSNLVQAHQSKPGVLAIGDLAVSFPRRSPMRSFVSDLERSASYFVLAVCDRPRAAVCDRLLSGTIVRNSS